MDSPPIVVFVAAAAVNLATEKPDYGNVTG